MALSCILGNGDAHLKNFGLLYPDPTVEEVRMAPAYDLMNTTAYVPEDGLALTLCGSRRLAASRVHLRAFARRCAVADADARIEVLQAAAEAGLAGHRDLLETEPVVRAGLHRAVEAFAARSG